jgi:hypothetical protein
MLALKMSWSLMQNIGRPVIVDDDDVVVLLILPLSLD